MKQKNGVCLVFHYRAGNQEYMQEEGEVLPPGDDEEQNYHHGVDRRVDQDYRDRYHDYDKERDYDRNRRRRSRYFHHLNSRY